MERQGVSKFEKPYDRSVKSLNGSENYEFSGESEYSRERSDPYQMVDYMIDHGVDFREKKMGVSSESTDEGIRDKIIEVLFHDAQVDASQIDVIVNEGIVSLSGNVDSRKTKRLIELSIESLSGIKDIYNRLRFKTTH